MLSTEHTALVTGATSGIGLATVIMLAKNGLDVVMIGRNDKKLLKIQEDNHHLPGNLSYHVVDLANPSEIDAFSSKILSELGNIGSLIHCAGIIKNVDIFTHGPELLDEHYSINVRAPYQLTRNLLPGIKSCCGQIVFVNSSAALQSTRKDIIAYGASKYALKSIADGVREQVNKFGIRVISIYPGRTATKMQESIFKFEGRDYKPELLIQPEDIAETIVYSLSLPNTVEITDISMRPFNKKID